MTNLSSLVRLAAKRAFQIRVQNGIEIDEPCDIYELAHKLGIELQFVDIPSLEGMYLYEPESQRICVSAHRPTGRQRYTTAHELGHHVFTHGTQFDPSVEVEVSARGLADSEILAEAFARYLLMPWRAVQTGFRLRGIDPSAAKAIDVYRIACWLGVGYSTLLYQMCYSLNVLEATGLKRLSRVSPKMLKSELAGSACTSDVWPLDELWANKRLHAQIGDLLIGLSPRDNELSFPYLKKVNARTYVATLAGEAEFSLANGGRTMVSVSRPSYVGFYEYRYLPE